MVTGAGGVQVRFVVDQPRPADTNAPPVSAREFDFPGPVLLRKSYIVASTPRCGSTFLSSLLWQTGVLGAPSEYWNCRKRASPKTIGTRMMERLEASSGSDYLTKLLACRTSGNGVFGVKVHFSHFEEVLRGFPQVLDLLSPVTYIYIERQDKLAQAVSMARSLQTGVWAAGRKRQRPALTYDKDLISKCLVALEAQRLGWLQWFETNNIEPYIVTYEKLVADAGGVVSGIVELLGAQNDKPQKVHQRTIEKQSDGINKEWAARFLSEIEAGEGRREADAGVAQTDRSAMGQPGDAHFFDRYNQVKSPDAKYGNLGVFAAKRRRDRYEAIIARNRELFQNARVLDIQCGVGLWSLAALDAGAAHVVCLDNRRKSIETAMGTFSKYGAKPELYEFVKAKAPMGLRAFNRGSFDLILCQDFSSLADLHLFFNHLHRLRPKHVILDMAITSRKQTAAFFKLATFKLKGQDAPVPDARRRRLASITAIPSHALISMLCDCFGFRSRIIDWQTFGISNWVGIGDYERDRRRTYVLDQIS